MVLFLGLNCGWEHKFSFDLVVAINGGIVSLDKVKKTVALRHLVLSAIAVSIIVLLCYFLWFPMPFLVIDGTWKPLLIMAGVDVVVGPLMTLLLVSKSKSRRELRVDLGLIIFLQVSALVYGVAQLLPERAVALVHSSNAFHLVLRKDIEGSYLADLPVYDDLYVAMVLDSDLTMHGRLSSKPLLLSPERYHKLAESEVRQNAIAHSLLPVEIAEEYGPEYLFKRLEGKDRQAAVVLDSEMNVIAIRVLPKNSQ